MFSTSNFQSLTPSLIHSFWGSRLGVVCLVWGCNASCCGILVKQKPINCFWEILVVLSLIYKIYSSGPKKDQLLASAVGLLLLLLGLG